MKSIWVVIILLCLGIIDCSKNLQIVGPYEFAQSSMFVVSIQKDGEHVCGGTIVSSLWVLTASVCINTSYVDYKIRYGVLDCYDRSRINATTRNIADEQISELELLSLLKVEIVLYQEYYRHLAILPDSQSSLPINRIGKLYGWDIQNISTENNLKTGKFFIHSRPCMVNRHLPTIFEFNAGGNGTGISEGNIGSPLLYNGLMIGVASGISSFNGSTTDIYYQVSRFVEWIRNTTGYNF